MGEWEVDSCAGENRRSLCVLPTKICDQLSVSVSQGGILEHFGCTERMHKEHLWEREKELKCTVVGWGAGCRIRFVFFFSLGPFGGIAVNIFLFCILGCKLTKKKKDIEIEKMFRIKFSTCS